MRTLLWMQRSEEINSGDSRISKTLVGGEEGTEVGKRRERERSKERRGRERSRENERKGQN